MQNASLKMRYHLTLFILVVDCSAGPTSYDAEDISARVRDKGIEVFNKLDIPVYHFAVEQDYAARIFWVPKSTPANEIEPTTQKYIPFSDIGGFKKGKKVILRYWNVEDPASENINHIIIDRGVN